MKKGYSILFSSIAIAIIAYAAISLISIPAAAQPSGFAKNEFKLEEGKSSILNKIQPGTLEKITFIHYAKPTGSSKQKAPSCYKLLGVKWISELPINYKINPKGSNLSESDILTAISQSVNEWDKYTSATLFGTGEIDYDANFDENYPDGKNEYSWGNYSKEGVIAVTRIWVGVLIGSRKRQIIEYDVLFDTDYNWFDCNQINCNEENKGMDLQNIATHETGHGLGLSDVYENACSEVTMYGYSWYGDIQKRDLASQDITGLQKLYGA